MIKKTLNMSLKHSSVGTEDSTMLVFKKICREISLEAYTKTPGTCNLYIYNCNKIGELNIIHHKIMESNIYYLTSFWSRKDFFNLLELYYGAEMLQIMNLNMETKALAQVFINESCTRGQEGLRVEKQLRHKKHVVTTKSHLSFKDFQQE